MAPPPQRNTRTRLLRRITCPHCWLEFPPESTLWISSDHPSLRDDPKIADGPRRFPAERFHVSGDAIDAVGHRCHALACPQCHLEVPKVLFEYPPFFVSIVGAPACGKSFFLAAMTWKLRTTLPGMFGTEFLDADPGFNVRLHEYERGLFMNPNRERHVTLEKTQVNAQAGLYDLVMLGEDTVAFPRPFIFRMQPAARSTKLSVGKDSSRAVCLYDNAGEQFVAGAGANVNVRATEHLGHADLTLFLFDPTQDMRYRNACHGKSDDPQMQSRESLSTREAAIMQHTIFINAASRMRQLRGLSERSRHASPLIVIATKLDTWLPLIPDSDALLRSTFVDATAPANGHAAGLHGLRAAEVERVSDVIRSVLQKYSPEVIAAAEGFSSNVTYVACSATGRNVQRMDEDAAALGIRPKDMNPRWCEVPFLMGLARQPEPLVTISSDRSPRVAESARMPDIIPINVKHA